jgi:hypothetical protein
MPSVFFPRCVLSGGWKTPLSEGSNPNRQIFCKFLFGGIVEMQQVSIVKVWKIRLNHPTSRGSVIWTMARQKAARWPGLETKPP